MTTMTQLSLAWGRSRMSKPRLRACGAHLAAPATQDARRRAWAALRAPEARHRRPDPSDNTNRWWCCADGLLCHRRSCASSNVQAELLSGKLMLAKVYGQEEPPAAEAELEWELRYFLLYQGRKMVHYDSIENGVPVGDRGLVSSPP